MMVIEGTMSAPTITIQSAVIVRPLKVIAVLLASFALLLMFLSMCATSWLGASTVREGLWEWCRYSPNSTDMMNCEGSLPKVSGWLHVCRAMCSIAMFLTFAGIITTALGLRSKSFQLKCSFYTMGMSFCFLAVASQLVSLVIYPVKFLEEIPGRNEAHWNFGWAYGVGWGAAVFDFTAGLLLVIDKGAEEMVYHEVTRQSEMVEMLDAV